MMKNDTKEAAVTQRERLCVCVPALMHSDKSLSSAVCCNLYDTPGKVSSLPKVCMLTHGL